ncbi:PucR family transcriptional regulator [Mesobacillus foraminis]|uniref:PucR-like helix-turn-helix protein n=1 Tax=Mesobacillus foraminis TaxID=279826 RepID=A0A4V6NKT2_9BACI|nr:PucR family transcriptional regulator [Mesobacillus foraminis]TCN27410.1 PucR-like helix-turn-helix protein [Mesobacillus foraminis]
MSFTVQNALSMPVLAEGKVIAGEQGLNRVITSVSIMDHPDTSWIKRGDLLLTTGYVFKDDLDAQTRLVRQLAKRGCAGLAIKLKRFISAVPDEMIQEANRYRLPLIEIPFEAALSDLLVTFTHEIVNREDEGDYGKSDLSIFKDLIDGKASLAEQDFKKLSSLGFNSSYPYSILLLTEQPISGEEISSIGPEEILHFAAAKKDLFRIWVVDHKGIALILQGDGNLHVRDRRQEIKEFANGLRMDLSKEYPYLEFSIGVSKEKKDLTGMETGFKEASRAILLGSKVHSHERTTIHEFHNLEAYQLISQVSRDTLTDYVESTIRPVLEYDRETGGELLKTLDVFFSARGKIEDTAKALYVHRNTVKFRLARIEELLAIDLKEQDQWFHLQLSIRAAKLL